MTTKTRTKNGAAPTAAGPVWRSRILGMEDVAPDQLLAHPSNWRTHPARQRDALRGSLDTVGWVQNVIVSRTTGHVVDGHARVEEAISRGEPTVPVVYVDLTEQEEALVLATLDPIGAMAEQSTERLTALLAEVSVDDAGLRRLLADLAPSRDPQAGLTDPDDAPALGAGSNITRGDLFALGEHRLLCGDATVAEDVARLMASVEAGCVWTDPPYGVAYVGKTKRRLEIENDERDDSALDALLREAFSLAIEYVGLGRAFYVASPSDSHVFLQVLADLGIYRQTLVWVKDSFVMSRADYHYRHEFIQYGWRPGAAHYFTSDRTLDTVWEIPRPKRSEEHPTMKPVELVARSLSTSSRPGEIVYDPFVGSGTTIIAAEQLGRRCYAMDIDPRYVAVAIERWQNFSGQKAVRL